MLVKITILSRRMREEGKVVLFMLFDDKGGCRVAEIDLVNVIPDFLKEPMCTHHIPLKAHALADPMRVIKANSEVFQSFLLTVGTT